MLAQAINHQQEQEHKVAPPTPTTFGSGMFLLDFGLFWPYLALFGLFWPFWTFFGPFLAQAINHHQEREHKVAPIYSIEIVVA
jgi:hypothetical protein